MNPPSTTREALIVEALGEAEKLIRQVEALAPALDQSRQALLDAHSGLAGQLDAFEARMAAIADNTKLLAVKHIARRTEEIARVSAEAQTRAMEEAARMLFRAEVGPALQRVAMPLHHLADLAQRGAHPWQHWLTHFATAIVASGVTWAAAAWLWLR